MFEGKFHLDGELVEAIMPFKDFEAFENYLKSIDEHYDEGSIIGKKTDIFSKTDTKTFNKVKRNHYGKSNYNIDKKSCWITR